ncbi:STM2901 family protein [Paraburkholderia sacchari]|uniref:Uncharacterized protein n=1 Tax=Paraburkholderia sacchari TaxID=159450 RepID=A0A8T6ZI58_9BURK|nr:hypothetical protein [Paraburkholderia sacchari]NLP64345.1 hypothetical protein [Paraburkholderia sacchari]
MNEYERLISDDVASSAPVKDNLYIYGEHKNLTPQGLFFCVMVEETCKALGVEDIVAVVAVLAGQPVLSTRGKFGGATRGTSIASKVSRALFDYDFERNILPTLTNKSILMLRFRMVNNLGVFIGRWTPMVGWAIAAYDVVKISVLTILHYNQLVNPEDRINDATTGSFG